MDDGPITHWIDTNVMLEELGPDVLAIQEPITGPIPPARLPLPPLL
jgi:hypothetical protein